ncbi:hypothetical protein PSCICN_19930 [Pseudomonas cichorii]|nr:hypothetical protein PSCICN_19930 [Pseudomonas cichorii]
MNKDLHGVKVMIEATQYRKLEILSLSPVTSKGRSTFEQCKSDQHRVWHRAPCPVSFGKTF